MLTTKKVRRYTEYEITESEVEEAVKLWLEDKKDVILSDVVNVTVFDNGSALVDVVYSDGEEKG